MDLLADRFNAAAVSIVGEDDRVAEIWAFVGLFGVDSNQVKLLPYLFKQTIKVELHIATDNHSGGLLCYEVDLFHGNCINLVETVQTLDVLSVAYIVH